MKRLIIFALVLIAYSASFAGNSSNRVIEERTVPEFNEIIIQGSVDVIFTQDNAVKVKVEGESDKIKNVITHVDNKVLKVDYKNGSSWFSSSGKLVVYATSPDLKKVKISGSGDFEIKNTLEGKTFELGIYGSGDSKGDFEVEDFTLKVQGSGDVNLDGVKNSINITSNGSGDVKAQDLELAEGRVNQYGSGDVLLEGNCMELSLKQSGSGDCHAKQLTVENADVKKSGSGDAILTVKNRLNIETSGSGDTHCYGNPSSVKQSVNGSGDLHIK